MRPPRLPALQQFGRFLGVGALATALQYLLLVAFVQMLAASPVPASSIAYALSTLFNYAANRRLSFASPRPHRSALPRFLLVAGIGLGLNTFIVWLGTGVLHMHYLMAQLLATALSLGWNFLACRHWAFQDTSHHEP